MQQNYGSVTNPDATQPFTTSAARSKEDGLRKKRRNPSFRSQDLKSQNKATGTVLGEVFSPKNTREISSSSSAKTHSWLYTLLNPRSNQPQAVFFKFFIASVILVDVVFFMASTEEKWNESPIFHIEEGIASSIFLFEYIARLVTVVESRYYGSKGRIIGRLCYMCSTSALIDALATFPFFLEFIPHLSLPTLTYLRVFRLIRILKTESYSRALDALWRVFYYNREIMYVGGLVCIFLVLLTAVLMYYLRPPDDDDFSSIANTMYIVVLLLTGQGGPDNENMPWYTKSIILMTGIFSVAVFAIPASMLTWGFEAEAARLAAVSRKRQKNELKIDSSSSEWQSNDDYDDTTDEEYRKIIAGEEGVDDDNEKMKQLMSEFESIDVDKSGSVNLTEFIEYQKNLSRESDKKLETRVQTLEDKVDKMNKNLEKLVTLLAKATNAK